jgi:hypothetical protein
MKPGRDPDGAAKGGRSFWELPGVRGADQHARPRSDTRHIPKLKRIIAYEVDEAIGRLIEAEGIDARNWPRPSTIELNRKLSNESGLVVDWAFP